MPPFLFRCPATGQNVQGWTADDGSEDEDVQPVTCLVCQRVHLVNPKTGKVLGADDD